jgi:hypothetical protein
MNEEQTGNSYEVVRDEVLSLLSKHFITLSLYGKGKAKKLEDLIDEVFKKEAKLGPNEKNELIREISIITAKIIYKNSDGRIFRLKENKQVFSDEDRERDRSKILGDNAISEKLFIGEGPELGVVRAIREELKIESGFTISKPSEPIMSEGISPSYPELNTITTRYQYYIEFDETAYKPDGYREERKGRITTWSWVEEGYTIYPLQ